MMKGPCKLEQLLPGPLKKRGVAAVLALVLALGSVFGIGGAKLSAYRSGKVDGLFATGPYSIATGLDARVNAAANILTVAKRVPGASEERMAALQTAINNMELAKGPAAKAKADSVLATEVELLYDQMVELARDAGQLDMLEGQNADFMSQGNILSHSDYNEAARQFNDLLDTFPASIIGGLWGIDQAEYYQ